MTDVEFTNALVCEDCRREENGKLILIGVFSGGVLSIQPFPLKFRPTFYLAGHATPGTYEIQFRFLPPSGRKPIFSAKATLTVHKENLDSRGRSGFGIPLPAPLLEIIQEGLYKLQTRANGSRWKTMLEVNIAEGEQ